MKKIAVFNHERFVFSTNEQISLKYDDPTFCILYAIKNGFLLLKHIEESKIEKFEKYNDAIKAFNRFVTDQLSNE